jgi:hypothetical protein
LGTGDPEAVRHVEYVETGLDKLIEQRAKGSTAAADRAKLWRESEETYRRERVEARTYAWITHHQRLSDVHRMLSEEHASKAAKLLSAGLPGGR